ncbi:MAG: hypothetical protein SFU86_24370 [Pirellulaceae bacterium]|nr:hypothetical protein [Pirellulaceae bacterium]
MFRIHRRFAGNLRRFPAGLLLSALSLASAGEAAAQAPALQRQVKETSLGRVDLSKYDAKKPTFWVSPNGRHAAWMTATGIVVDGQAPKQALVNRNGDMERTFQFSPDGEHWAYVAYLPESGVVLVRDGVPSAVSYNGISHKPAFSRDGRHLAHFASQYQDGLKQFIVLDGKPLPPEKDMSWEIAFTADGKQMIYGVEVGGQMVMRTHTLDGGVPHVERPHRPAVMIRNFFYGPQGQVGYIGKAGENQYFVVYDGQEDPNRFHEAIQLRDIVISDDGRHLAYLAAPASFADVAVVDGKPGKTYRAFEDIVPGSLGLSPDGSRSAYSVKKSREAWVMLDGQEGKHYASVGGAVFSPDSKHVAYQAASGGKLLMVVDGREGQAFDKIGLPEFSPDSQTVAYWAQSGTQQFVVAGGQKQKAYASVGTPLYSPDGKRLVYLAQAGEKWLLVDAGREGKAYDDTDGELVFSGDGQRLATVFTTGEKQLVVVDGSEGEPYDEIITFAGGKLHFPTAGKLHYLARRDDELKLVEETLP